MLLKAMKRSTFSSKMFPNNKFALFTKNDKLNVRTLCSLKLNETIVTTNQMTTTNIEMNSQDAKVKDL